MSGRCHGKRAGCLGRPALAASCASLPIVALLCAAPLLIPASYAQTDYPHLGIRVETVADNLQIPWSVDWLPDGTMLFTERGGSLSILRDGHSKPELVHEFASGGAQEAGLLGVTVDPDFENNGFVYVYYTYDDLFTLYNKIERYRYVQDDSANPGAGALRDGLVILDRIPATPWHDGGRIQFGPDGMLYAATGDAIKPELSQDVHSLAGKILRMNPDGTVPGDNPHKNILAYSVGHRNPQGMDWTDDGTMIATEHGPSGFLGIGHDEINVITPGGNYGWPEIVGSAEDDAGGRATGQDSATAYIDPILHTGSNTWAPSGAEFYESDVIPEWSGRYFVATLFGQSLQMVRLGPTGQTVESHTALFEGEFGRLRDVQTGPDGYLYVLTSNRDGRGSPAPADDRILRILPLYEPAAGTEHANDQVQRLATISYEGPETAQTGPLGAALRHPGYDVSNLVFDILQKGIAFDFERSAATSSGAADASLSLYVERPLVSAPFEVVIYDESGAVYGPGAGGDGGNTYSIRYAPDHYVITVDAGDVDAGSVEIIGAHVVPEFYDVLWAVVAASAAAVIMARYAMPKFSVLPQSSLRRPAAAAP